MERVKGIEASADNPQEKQPQHVEESANPGYTQIRAQIQGSDGRDLSQVVNAWAELPAALKAAILAIVNANTIKGGQ